MALKPLLKFTRLSLTSYRRLCMMSLMLLCIGHYCISQSQLGVDKLRLFEQADTFHKTRFWIATGTTVGIYSATVLGLNEIWYKQYPRRSFHVQDDWGEWNNMDKCGHMFTAYLYSKWIADVARWTGIESKNADWIGVGASMVFQTTIEIMDGFSDRWGFSWSDMAFNALGAGVYIGQQRLWGEQRVMFKFSSYPIDHPQYSVESTDGESVMTLNERASDLFGTGFFEMLLKDYNAQTIWTSVNIHAFMREDRRFPKWLNVAFGYGAYNMYGGYSNRWEKDGATFILDDSLYPRYRQYYLTLDVDLTRIPTRSPFLRTVLSMLNVIKLPAPAIEFNKVDGVRWHALKF